MDKCRQCRKFGTKLFLKGEKCISPKCPFTRRSYRPGLQGAKTKMVRKSEYGSDLFEKQKAKAEYGLRERQFVRFFKQASKSRQTTGEQLLRLLEMRFDNIIFRLGWAASRLQARQMINHRKFKINNKIINIPSIILQSKDKIQPLKREDIKIIKATIPKWLKVDNKNMIAEIIRPPIREEIETDLDEQKILEFYSR